MKLELASFPVNDVRFSNQTSYEEGLLKVDKEELVELVLEDRTIASADLDVAFPNEETRIVNVVDVVEPRIKVFGPGCVFPGILGPVETVGDGRTHRLYGVTVATSAQYQQTDLTGTGAANFSMIDMWGPGIQWSPFASTINIVLILKLADGVTELDAHNAVQSAEFKVAQRLAETTRHLIPQDVEVFELGDVEPSLPRIIYILTLLSMLDDARPTVSFYGLPVGASLPTFIHPNEILDGALTRDACKGNPTWPATTWSFLNNPVVLELLRDHGKRLNFLGVIFQRTRFISEHGKHVTAQSTSQLVKLLGADGVILTNSTQSGNNLMDVMWTLEGCENKGVKTVYLTPEGGISSTDAPFPFFVPKVGAMVSTGCYMERGELELPRPAKVIGVEKGRTVSLLMAGDFFSPWDQLTGVSPLAFADGVDWFGAMNNTQKEY
jgi:sarcosine reductase